MRGKGVVERARGKVFLCQLFTVSKKEPGKTRLVMDLSAKNSHSGLISTQEGRMAGVPGPPGHPRFQHFLAFQVEDETFQFIRVLFRLSLAQRIFTKLVRGKRAYP